MLLSHLNQLIHVKLQLFITLLVKTPNGILMHPLVRICEQNHTLPTCYDLRSTYKHSQGGGLPSPRESRARMPAAGEADSPALCLCSRRSQ